MKRDDILLHKRTYPRVTLTLPVQIRLKNVTPTVPSTLRGKITNLSREGLSVIVENLIRLSSLVPLYIHGFTISGLGMRY